MPESSPLKLASRGNEFGEWLPYVGRYRDGTPRALIFRDIVLSEVTRQRESGGDGKPDPVFLDIGCGSGFDSFKDVQQSLMDAASQYIGVEPDRNVPLDSGCAVLHRCRFEEAPIADGSIDLAFAVMVLEHLEQPNVFWDKVHRVLRPGGVFWGFTVDARHWFTKMSQLMEKMHIKDWYLNALHGRRGRERYENYSVFYRSNTPSQIDPLTRAFSDRVILNFSKTGQLDFYFSPALRWVGRIVDATADRVGSPGAILAVRVTK